eukprot:6009819-Pyramimonas_sp.AAC.1
MESASAFQNWSRTSAILRLCSQRLSPDDLALFLVAHRDFDEFYTPSRDPTASEEELRDVLRLECERGVSGSTEIHIFVASTGSAMQPQFKPWYFGVAFAFLFKLCIGMPDMPQWPECSRHRRGDEAPRVELPLWTKTMTRRAEQHLKRDWLFGFSMWNILFRSALNQRRT